jgi:energy-coupling factor transport system permease protein
MATAVPVLYQERDTVIHRRDPRVKMLLFALLFVFLFVAPTWQWMLVPTLLGILLALVTRTPWKWLAVLWLIHVPSFLVIVGIPAAKLLLAGKFTLNDELAGGLRLLLAWTGAIFVSVSLFSTMDSDDIIHGLQGLGVPRVAAFAVGLSYRLLFLTLRDILQIADAMKIKGVDLETKQPVRLIRHVLQLSFPILFAVVRQAPILMAALEMRGFLQPRQRQAWAFDTGDVALAGSGFLVCGVALIARLGLLP